MAPHTRLAATWLVAMSSTSRPSPAGAAKEIGLVPSSGSRPPKGTTPGSAFVVERATRPRRATSIV